MYPTLLSSFISWPSPLWGPAHQGIQFLASAAHWYGCQVPVVGAAKAWQQPAAPDMLFGRQGMHIPACPVGCLAAETTPGKASRWGPYSPGPRPKILGCCGGPNRAQTKVKSPSQVPEKNLGDVFTLYCKYIWGVFTTYSYALPMYQGCIRDVL